MRLRHDPSALEYLENHKDYIFANKNLNLSKIFNNQNPIHIEIGSGKGKFITTLAKQNPNINYIAIEKYPTVLKNIALKQDDLNLFNLRFMSFDATLIEEIFEKNSIDKVYLNFSDPWPKARHFKRRLTYIGFLNKYKTILKDDKIVEFKTDNSNLIEFTLETLNDNNISIIHYNSNLHDSVEKNIKTEYEEKFSKKGFNIHKVVFKLCD